jgi:hypothetical protein
MRHRGHKKAMVAVAQEQATRRHVRQLVRLGHLVILEPVA